jgi:hypothetical protein
MRSWCFSIVCFKELYTFLQNGVVRDRDREREKERERKEKRKRERKRKKKRERERKRRRERQRERRRYINTGMNGFKCILTSRCRYCFHLIKQIFASILCSY